MNGMRRVLIVGAGAQGGPCASILARDEETSEVVLGDIDLDLANKVKEKIGSEKVTTTRLDAGKIEDIWEDYRPVILQTAACGLKGSYDDNPPYYRKVKIDGKGRIVDFRVRDREGLVDFKEGV